MIIQDFHKKKTSFVEFSWMLWFQTHTLCVTLVFTSDMSENCSEVAMRLESLPFSKDILFNSSTLRMQRTRWTVLLWVTCLRLIWTREKARRNSLRDSHPISFCLELRLLYWRFLIWYYQCEKSFLFVFRSSSQSFASLTFHFFNINYLSRTVLWHTFCLSSRRSPRWSVICRFRPTIPQSGREGCVAT